MSIKGSLLSGISVLAVVVERGSFSSAGETLGMSASGVSRAISRLEKKMGVRLFDRTTRTLKLTRDGESLYQLAVPHLEGIEEAATHVASSASIVKGPLRVSINPIFARHILAPNLNQLRERYPLLELIILQQPDVGDMISEGVDVAIRFGPQPASTMTSRLLLKTRVLTVAAPDYLAKNGFPNHPEELVGKNCIQYIDPRSGKPFVWEFHRNDEILKVNTWGNTTTSDVDLMVQACREGAGIAQILALNASAHLNDGSLIELFPEWDGESYPLYIVRPSRRLAPASVNAFIDFCFEICRDKNLYF